MKRHGCVPIIFIYNTGHKHLEKSRNYILEKSRKISKLHVNVSGKLTGLSIFPHATIWHTTYVKKWCKVKKIIKSTSYFSCLPPKRTLILDLKLPTLFPITLIMIFKKPKLTLLLNPKAEKGEFKAVTKCFPPKFPFTVTLKTVFLIHLLMGLWWKRASATFEQLWQWSHLCRWVHLTAPCTVYSSHVLSPAHPLPLKDKMYRSWKKSSFWLQKEDKGTKSLP